MRLFSPIYERVMRWSAHPRANWYLAALSFAESSFFPIPPDVMLAPMTLARPDRGWRYAVLTTTASVVGGMAGYALGWFALELVEPVLKSLNYWPAYELAERWFDEWGFWAILVAGFSPVPYKVFTISAGALHTLFPMFIIASLIGRGARFFLVAGLVIWGGERVEQHLKRHIDTIGWLVVAALVVGYLLWRFL